LFCAAIEAIVTLLSNCQLVPEAKQAAGLVSTSFPVSCNYVLSAET